MTNMPVVTNIEALRSLTLRKQGYVLVLGYHNAGDGGGGIFFWSDTVETDDGGMIIEPIKDGPLWKLGCWKRILEGPVNIKWFGAKGDGEAEDTDTNTKALEKAINLVRTDGGTVFCPAGKYVLNSFTIPASVIVRGAGKRATRFLYSGAGTLVTLGGRAHALYYGCGISDCEVDLLGLNGQAIRVQGCAGAEVARLYIEGPISIGRCTTGVVIDGGNASSFFNRVVDVQCNHIENGFWMVNSGGEPCTQTTFENCQSFGDFHPIEGPLFGTSVGFTVEKQQGHGSMWIGGNFESCGTGIEVKDQASSVSVTGARFEGNEADVRFGSQVVPWSFFQCSSINPAKVIPNAGKGFENHQFIGCVRSDERPYENQFVGCSTIRAGTQDDVPFVIEAYPGTISEDALRIRNSAGRSLLAVSALGEITKLHEKDVVITAGSGSPEGTVTAAPGSIFLRVDGGSTTTLYVKESGTGNTGWVGK